MMQKFILVVLIFSCIKSLKNIDIKKNKDIDKDLVIAINNDETDEALELIENVANLNYIFDGKSILELSLNKENLEIIAALIKKKIEINKDNIVKIYDLALEYSHYNIINLIKDNYKLEEGLIDNNKYLLFLCYTSDAEEINKFVKNNEIDLTKVKDKMNKNYLILSAYWNKMDIFKILIEKYNFDINYKDDNGWTALMYISQNGNLNEAKLLIEKDAIINHESDEGFSALILASQNGHKKIVELLIENGANDFPIALMSASLEGHIEIAKILIDKGADVNYKGSEGWTILMMACDNGHTNIVKLLIEKVARINEENNYSWTSLMVASNNGYIEIVKLLIGAGAKINNKEGYWTALMLASENNHKEVVKILIENGADVNKRTENYSIALIIALENGYSEVVEILIKRGANIYKENRLEIFLQTSLFNKTPLMTISKNLKFNKEKSKKGNFINIAYLIVKKMAEDYIQLFISLNKNLDTPQELKDEIHNYINLLYCLQRFPTELFEEVIKNFDE